MEKIVREDFQKLVNELVGSDFDQYNIASKLNKLIREFLETKNVSGDIIRDIHVQCARYSKQDLVVEYLGYQFAYIEIKKARGEYHSGGYGWNSSYDWSVKSATLSSGSFTESVKNEETGEYELVVIDFEKAIENINNIFNERYRKSNDEMKQRQETVVKISEMLGLDLESTYDLIQDIHKNKFSDITYVRDDNGHYNLEFQKARGLAR